MLLNFLARSHELFSHAQSLHAIATPAPPKFTSILWQSPFALRRRRCRVEKGGTENEEARGNGWSVGNGGYCSNSDRWGRRKTGWEKVMGR